MLSQILIFISLIVYFGIGLGISLAFSEKDYLDTGQLVALAFLWPVVLLVLTLFSILELVAYVTKWMAEKIMR